MKTRNFAMKKHVGQAQFFNFLLFIKAWLLILLGVAIGGLQAQTGGKIVGTVVDAESGDPLIGANIVIEGTTMGAAADEEGFFMIIDVPPGVYTVVAEMIGYQKAVATNVKVVSNLTTKLKFKLKPTTIEGEEVRVEAYKNPPVQQDLTYKIQAVTAAEIARVPIITVRDLLTQQAGIVRQIRTAPVSSLPVFGQFATIPSDGLHFRGGRENETLFLLDGVMVNDQLWGGFNIDKISELLINSMETYSGTFGPEYGYAMSGVVSVSTLEPSGVKPTWGFKAFSDKHGIKGASHNTYSVDLAYSSLLPFARSLGLTVAHRVYSTDGYIYGYIYPNYVDSEGTDKSGTPKKVPMQYLDTQFTYGKLVWKPSSNFSMRIGGYLGKTQKGVYNHYFKYNPYGTPRVWLDDDLIYTKVDWVISPKTIMKFNLSHYLRLFKSYVWDNPEYYQVIPQIGGGEFSIAGEDWVYFNSEFRRTNVSLDFLTQIGKIHSVTSGISFSQLKTHMIRRNPDGWVALEEYNYNPTEASFYLHDKMEFDDMGLIVNAGFRADYVDTKHDVLVNVLEKREPDAPLTRAKPHFFIGPRLGVSFPVAEKMAFRFGYGHYYQYPAYFKVFEGYFYSQATGQYRPNPNIEQTPIADTEIKPEKTINYEAGVQARISNDVSLDVVGFYRKSSNLIGVKVEESPQGDIVTVLGNIDYSTVKGIEVSLRKQFSNNFSAFFNYTFTKTLVTTSVLFERAQDVSRTFPANWDQPHSFRANIYYEHPKGWGFSLYASASSGFPYTRSRFNPNGERAPWISDTNLNLFKNFKWFGFKQQFYIQILNVINRRNVWWVYPDSGIPGDDANPATSHDYTDNPAMYGPGRVIQFGVKLWN